MTTSAADVSGVVESLAKRCVTSNVRLVLLHLPLTTLTFRRKSKKKRKETRFETRPAN